MLLGWSVPPGGWIAALFVMGLWLSVAIATLVRLRTCVLRRADLDAGRRWDLYRRRLQPLTLALFLYAWGMFFLLDANAAQGVFSAITRQLGYLGVGLLYFLFEIPCFVMAWTLGAPLERDANPDVPYPPRLEAVHRAFRWNLWRLLGIAAFGCLWQAVAGDLTTVRPWLHLTGGIGLLLGVMKLGSHLARPDGGTGGDDGAQDESGRRNTAEICEEMRRILPDRVASAVRETTARLECPIQDVQLYPALLSEDSWLTPVLISGKEARLATVLLDAFSPDEIAALVAAAALREARTPWERWRERLSLTGVWLLVLAMPVVLLLGWFASPWFSYVGKAVATGLAVTLPFVFIGGGREKERGLEADRRAAEALGDPKQFLEVLRRLEEQSPKGVLVYRVRRERLAKRLKLDR